MNIQILLEFSSASILLLVGTFLLIIPNKKNIGVLYLALFMGLLGIHHFYLLAKRLFPVLEVFNEKVEFLSLLMYTYCVLLFLFTKHYLVRANSFQKKTSWIFSLFIPPIVILIVENIYGLKLNDLRTFINLGLAVFIIAYNLISIRNTKTPRLESSLLIHVNGSFLLMMLIWSAVLINRYISMFEESYVVYLFLTSELILVYGIVFYGMSNPFLFKGFSIDAVPQKTSSMVEGGNDDEKYKNSKLSEFEIKKLAKVISDEVAKHNLYLKPDLTMEEVGERLDLSPRVVSQVINTTYGNNFSDFVNTYRLNHAKELLLRSEDDLSIKEIMYMSGFNSKSNFYGVFKRKVGMTPNAYRKKVRRHVG
ncbi:helix-turn-helix transcriptional regulator [Muricauda sp. NFXS6]|uniref:helix-turn-helix domain-containing protein n=1 Tax=Allomuricauda sp. NFXS6 TaxID=2819094 RepID=UPI0032E00B59